MKALGLGLLVPVRARSDVPPPRCLITLVLVAVVLTGCLGRLIADKGMSDEDLRECDSLVEAVRTRFALADFESPEGLDRAIGTRVSGGDFPRDEPWPEEGLRAIGCRTEVSGLLLALYTVVEVWRVVEAGEQASIVQLVRERRGQLSNPKPTIVRFIERERWVLHHDVNGEARGSGRGEERLLKSVTIR
jgi:hypothetical protein